MQRIIRSKDSKFGRLVGGVRTAESIASAIALAKRSKKVYTFIDSEGNEGIIRSGRKMRTCDSHVRNTLHNGGPLPKVYDIGKNDDTYFFLVK